MTAVNFQQRRAGLFQLRWSCGGDGLRHAVRLQHTVRVLPEIDESGAGLGGILFLRTPDSRLRRLSRNALARAFCLWIPAPVRDTGPAFRRNDGLKRQNGAWR